MFSHWSRLGVGDTAFFQKMNIFIEWIIRLFFEWMNSLNEYFWFSFEWINSLNEYFRRTNEWIIEWIRKVRYSYEKWTKSAFFGRNGPLLPVFHCFLKLWFVFQFEWIILLNEYFWFNFEWIILLNEYSRFNFELNIELNHFLARFNVKMNNQNLSATPTWTPWCPNDPWYVIPDHCQSSWVIMSHIWPNCSE